MIALVVNTKNEIRRVKYDPPHYDVIKEAVGGWYERVHPMGLDRPYSMMVNEEGLLLGLPMNRLGSELYGTPQAWPAHCWGRCFPQGRLPRRGA